MSEATARPMRDAMSLPAVRTIVLGFHALTLGEWVLGSAVAIDVFRLGGAFAVGLVGFRFASASAASLFTSNLSGMFGRRLVLAGSAAGHALATVGVATALLVHAPLALVIGLVWIDAAIGSAYRPALVGLLPSLVFTPTDLTAAAALTSNAKSLGQILGALLGGILISLIGVQATVFVAAGLYALSAVLSWIGAAGDGGKRAGATSDRAQWLAAGFKALLASRETRRVASWSCGRSLVRGLWVALGVIASLTFLHMGKSGFGFLTAAAGVGTVAGVVLSGRLVGRDGLAGPFAWSLALSAFPLAAIGLAANAPAALVLMVVWGIGMSLSDVGAQSLLSRLVAPWEVSRVVGVIESSKLLSEALGGLLAPALVHLFGIRDALIVSGVVLTLVVLVDQRGFRAIDRVARGQLERLELVRGVPLFASLRVDGLEAVVAPLQPVMVAAGEDVIVQDTLGTLWYLVVDGECEVLVDGYVIGSASRGDSFGERGLLRDQPRTATVRAKRDSSLLALERSDFLRAVTGTDEVDTVGFREHALSIGEALHSQHLFSDLSHADVETIAARSSVIATGAGEILFAQGDVDDRYFVILGGHVEIQIDGATRRELGPGDDFGEIAVLHRVARTGAAVAQQDTRVVAIPGDVLREFIGVGVRQPDPPADHPADVHEVPPPPSAHPAG